MKKLFLLIPSLLLTVALNAAVMNVTTSSYEGSDVLRKALYYSNAGDTIVMATGTYEESNSDYIAWKRDNVVMAAEGASVIIKPHVSFRVKGGARAELIGVKIDASGLGSYKNIFESGENIDGNRLILKNCEIYGNPNESVVRCASDKKLDSLIINNCYIHNNAQVILRLESASLKGLTVTNSTFANIANGGSFWVAPMEIKSAASGAKVIVDHCTFYNVQSISLSYGLVNVGSGISDATVSNCIFMLPATADMCATNLQGGGDIKNTLTYNYDNWQECGHYETATLTNCFKADPLFTDAANADYSFPGNWVTMSLSPARGAATDGSDLGDPRWYSAEVLPETDFASPYVLLGEKAQLSGSFALNGSNYIQSQDKTYDGIAIWKIHAERKGTIQITLNIDPTNGSGHRYEFELFDADNIAVGSPVAEAADSWSKGDQILGSIEIPEAGDYKIRFSNHTNNSSTILQGVTLTYLGGAVVPVSPTVNTTLDIADALFSGCTREAGYIQYPSSGTSSAWIKWNISTSATASYDITVNINTEYAHGFTAAVYEDESAAPVASVTEGSYINTKGDGLALELGKISLAGGKNYVVKVSNAPSGSQAKVLNLVFAPAVSSTINLPNSLPLASAVTSSSSMVGIDGDQMYFSPDPSHQNSKDQWAQWSVHVSEAASYLCSMDVTSTNEQSYKISILNGSNEEICVYEKNPGSGNKTLKQYFYLPIGDYTVRVTSTYSWSAGRLVSIEFTKPANVITLDDNADNSAVISANLNDGAKNVQIIRTLKGGVFNTFCLPFAVSYTMVPQIFGTGVEIYTLKSTTLVDATLDLAFETSSGIYQGTPVLIKPVKDVVNPFFEGVEILVNAPASSTSSYTNFVGTFSPTTIEASPNNLFLGPNNTLYFPENNDQPIKGMRGWFILHDAPAGIISRARIVAQNQVVTAVDLVNGTKLEKPQKVLVNGQLRIIVDGVEYNALGTRVK